MFEGSFEDSLRSLVPSLSADTKSRLLFECGMAAAETKIRHRQRKLSAFAFAALSVAASLGFVIGNQYSNPNQQVAVVESEPVPAEPEAQSTSPTLLRKRNTTTLAVAMAPNQVSELLDRIDSSEDSDQPEAPASRNSPFGKSPFGIHSLTGELE